MRPDELVDRYYGAVYNLAYRALGRRDDAEDVAQQTFARALPRLSDLRQPGAAQAWLLRIATNLALDELRRRGRLAAIVDEPPVDWAELPDDDRSAAPSGAAELRELRLRVWRATLGLPQQQRLALALREMHGMGYVEIADALSTSVAAVETLLFRARQGFRRLYSSANTWHGRDATCDGILERLSASIDGELAPDEQARVDAHLPGCPSCQFAARELRATSRLYSLLPFVMPSGAAQATTVLVASAITGTGASVAGGVSLGAAGAGAAVGV